MLINWLLTAKLWTGRWVQRQLMESKVSRTRRLLAYALQLNRPAEFANGDAGEPWWTYSGTLERLGHRGNLTKVASGFYRNDWRWGGRAFPTSFSPRELLHRVLDQVVVFFLQGGAAGEGRGVPSPARVSASSPAGCLSG